MNAKDEDFSVTHNSWATEMPMPTARYALTAVTGPDGRLYAIGGYDSNGSSLNTMEAYTP